MQISLQDVCCVC